MSERIGGRRIGGRRDRRSVRSSRSIARSARCSTSSRRRACAAGCSSGSSGAEDPAVCASGFRPEDRSGSPRPVAAAAILILALLPTRTPEAGARPPTVARVEPPKTPPAGVPAAVPEADNAGQRGTSAAGSWKPAAGCWKPRTDRADRRGQYARAWDGAADIEPLGAIDPIQIARRSQNTVPRPRKSWCAR